MKEDNNKWRNMLQRITTGIEGFEHISLGELPKDRTALLSGSSGSGKTSFAIEFIVNVIVQYDDNGVFVTFEETPKDIIKNFKPFN